MNQNEDSMVIIFNRIFIHVSLHVLSVSRHWILISNLHRALQAVGKNRNSRQQFPAVGNYGPQSANVHSRRPCFMPTFASNGETGISSFRARSKS